MTTAAKRQRKTPARRTPDKPASARTIDLDAARKARQAERAKKGDGTPTFTVGGDSYELPPELPVEVLDGFGRAAAEEDPMAVFEALEVLLGDNYDDVVKKHKLSFDDVMVLLEASLEGYGVNAGK